MTVSDLMTPLTIPLVLIALGVNLFAIVSSASRNLKCYCCGIFTWRSRCKVCRAINCWMEHGKPYMG